MRKFIALLVMCFVAVSSTPSFAQVGLKVDNTNLGTVTKIRYNTSSLAGQNKALKFSGSELTFNLLQSGTGTSGAVSLGTGNQDVPRGYSLVLKAIGTSVESGIIHNGLPGELITIRITERGANGTWNLTSSNSTTWTKITFNTVGQTLSLLYISDAVGWIQFGESTAAVAYTSF